MSAPLAYFLTWTCYGNRLHGHPDGSVDRRNNTPGAPLLAPDPLLESQARARMAGPAFVLSERARVIADETVRTHCKVRSCTLLALNVRTTHVHVVVNCHERASPETAMDQFKAWITRKFRENGLAGADQRVWTEHGSTRWINSASSLAKAVDYVLHEQ